MIAICCDCLYCIDFVVIAGLSKSSSIFFVIVTGFSCMSKDLVTSFILR